jgi:hypothetical protein
MQEKTVKSGTNHDPLVFMKYLGNLRSCDSAAVTVLACAEPFSIFSAAARLSMD